MPDNSPEEIGQEEHDEVVVALDFVAQTRMDSGRYRQAALLERYISRIDRLDGLL